MPKIFILLTLFFSFTLIIKAQNEQHDVIASAGDYFVGNDITASITFGEAIAETVYGNNIIATQGFQQPLRIPIKLSIKAFLQGCFFASEMTPFLNIFGFLPHEQPYNIEPWNYMGNEAVDEIPSFNVIDWVLVEIRQSAGDASTAISDSVVDVRAGLLLRDGTITGIDGISPLYFHIDVSDNLYAVVYHRNHVAIMTANPLEYTGGLYLYDYTISSDNIYGGELVCKELAMGIWGMLGGNGDHDLQIDNNDKNEIWVQENYNAGYKDGDYNMNGQVDEPDKTVIWNNNSGRGGNIPE